MIKIDFSSAISVYLSFSIFLVFTLWLFYTLRRNSNGILNETKYLHQCPYCTYIFFNYRPKADSLELTAFEAEKKGKVLEAIAEEAVPANTKTNLLICPQCKSYIHPANNDQEGER